ncbi:helix-turn-helix domain-containing protein [Azonexus sp. IMCC34839]|uniref:helix-turn-helix domain-containing protein n=1 Tax=Azonexus sp. IMCC34839 TaxID=3133695 RepID=UPI00399AFA54
MNKKRKQTISTIDVIQARKSSGLNQSDFWGRIGVTQSGGSRYESGRAMPKPTQMLFQLVYQMDEKSAFAELEKLRFGKKNDS